MEGGFVYLYGKKGVINEMAISQLQTTSLGWCDSIEFTKPSAPLKNNTQGFGFPNI